MSEPSLPEQVDGKRRVAFTIRFEYDVWDFAWQLTDDVILEQLYDAVPGVIPDPADGDEGAVLIQLSTYVPEPDECP